MATLSAHSQLLPLLSSFSSQNPSQFTVLQSALDDLSRELVSDKSLRIQLGSESPSIWTPLHELWSGVTRTQSAETGLDGQHILLVLSLAKFTRNIVAEVPLNQKNAFPVEPQIRQLIYLLTSWTKDNNESRFATTRMLTQTLSNLVTGNQELLDLFWSVHLEIPEEQSGSRLLSLPDSRTVLSVLVLIMNCIHESSERGHALVTASIGIRICVSILDKLEGPKDVPELEDETKVFELGYTIFSKLFQMGLFPELYNRASMDDEPVSPTQTTLLKFLDSYLNSVPTPFFRDRDDHRDKLAGFLASVFLLQARYTRHAIQQATGGLLPGQNAATEVREGGETATRADGCALDGRLPGIWIVLVLLSTSLSSILLAEQEDNSGASTDPGVVTLTHLCHDTISAARSRTGAGFVEELLETLGLLHDFLPRINFGKVRASPEGKEAIPRSADATDFPYLKRDLVRLLGILCHNCKAIQDRVRLCGGVPVVLNLCAIDDRNPYLREHALFALRNLLHNNTENQAIVDTFQAEEHVGPTVVVRDVGAK